MAIYVCKIFLITYYSIRNESLLDSFSFVFLIYVLLFTCYFIVITGGLENDSFNRDEEE